MHSLGNSGQRRRHRKSTIRRTAARLIPAAALGAGMLISNGSALALDSAWNVDASGDWSLAGNWSAGVPNAVGDAARFLGAITAPQTVTQDVAGLTLGIIEFNNANAYTISGGNAIALDAATTASILVNNSNGNGAHTISTPIALADPLNVTQNSTGALTLSAAVTGAHAITKEGSGSLLLTGTTSNGINGITVNAGAMVLSKTGVATAVGIGISTITIGDSLGGANADVLVLGGASQFPTGVRIFITPSGLLNGGTNFNLVTGGVTMTGGMILNPRLRLTANTNVLAHTESAVISGGSIEFFGSTRTFNVADGAAIDDLIVSSRISNGGLIKSGPGQLVLSGAEANDYAAGTTVNTGTVIAAKATAFGTGSLSVTGGTVRLSPSLPTAVKVTGLSVTGSGVVDVTDNDMVIDYTGATPFDSIRTLIVNGFAAGAWNGLGINSSSAAVTPAFALGYAEASAIFTTFPATFGGLSVDNTSVLIAYTRSGDANLDNLVNLTDFNRLAANFGSTSAIWNQGDFNYDGLVNLTDFNRLAANFGLSASADGPTPQDWANLAAVVPEPVVASGVLVCALLLRRRRCR